MLALHVEEFSFLGKHAHAIGIGFSVTIITLLQVVIGELFPKRLSLVSPEPLAVFFGQMLWAISRLTYPLVSMLSAITNLLLRMVGVKGNTEAQVSEEEIRMLVAESAEQGVIDNVEKGMVNRVLRLGDRTVASLMTPRPQISWLDSTSSTDENLQLMRGTPYSRYPVMNGSDKDVAGVFEVKTLLEDLGPSQQLRLFRQLTPPLFVPETTDAISLLQQLREAETAMAFVVDEYGDLQGIVTVNDVLGAVIGPSAGQPQDADSAIMQREDGSYLVDGQLPIEDLKELLHLQELPKEDEHDFHTIAGMVMAHFGRIPKLGDHFEFKGVRIEVIDLDGARIDKLLVTPPHA
jgi:putative hemolysin